MSGSSYDPRLVAYFGDPVLQSGFLPVPHLLLRHYAELGLNSHQAMFVLHLMSTTWDLGSPALNIGQLARRMGVSRRTAQIISAELHERGLIDIFDQYDQGGAQIENGYDLSGLFQRLAAFAPAPRPSGTQRQRRERARATSSDLVPATAAPQVTGTGEQSYAASCAPPMQPTAPPLCSRLHPAPAMSDAPPTQPTAGLKTESKNLQKNQQRKQKEQQPAAAKQLDWFGRDEQERGGRSLRWDTQLSSLDVHQSRQILARIGLNADVADRVAGTVHPAEVWALWLHARAAGLGIAWIARQLYDPQRKQPRMAGIPGPCEAAGRLLAALPPDTASIIIDITLDQGTDPEGLVTAEVALATDPRSVGQDLTAQLKAVWAVLESTRRSGTAHVFAPATSARGDAQAPHVEEPRWILTKSHLATRIPVGEYATWIDPLELVHVDDTVIVVGAPNVIVRTAIQHEYAAALQEALELAWGRAVTIDVVIEQARAA